MSQKTIYHFSDHTPLTGEDCTVVLAGRVFKCRIVEAEMRQDYRQETVSNMDGSIARYPVSNRVSMTIKYDVLAEVTLNAVEQRAIASVLDGIGPTRRIDFED